MQDAQERVPGSKLTQKDNADSGVQFITPAAQGSEPGVSGDFWGSQEGCQGPSRLAQRFPASSVLAREGAGCGKWQPTPVFLPGESQGWRSLLGCRLWGRTESDMTDVTQQQQQA